MQRRRWLSTAVGGVIVLVVGALAASGSPAYLTVNAQAGPTPTPTPDVPTPSVQRPGRLALIDTSQPPALFTEFSRTDLEPWLYVNRPDPANWRSGGTPGVLQITTQLGDFLTERQPRNIVLTAANFDLDARTRVTFQPSGLYEQAGLILYQDDGNFIKLVRTQVPSLGVPGSPPLDGFQALYVSGGEFRASGTLPFTGTVASLRLRREGPRVDAAYTTDGVNYTAVATFLDVVLANTQVGLYATGGPQATGNHPVATFDWLRVQRLAPILPFVAHGAQQPSVVVARGATFMFFTGAPLGDQRAATSIGLATSTDGVTFTAAPTPIVLTGEGGANRDNAVSDPVAFFDGTIWRLWYSGYQFVGNRRLGDVYLATSTDGVNFTRANRNRDGVTLPVLGVGAPGAWDDLEVRPGSVIRDGSVFRMYYLGRSQTGGTGIGTATSTDGVNWVKASHNPIIRSASSPRGVIRADGATVLFFVQGGAIVTAVSGDGVTFGAPRVLARPDTSEGSLENALNDPFVLATGSGFQLFYTAGAAPNDRQVFTTVGAFQTVASFATPDTRFVPFIAKNMGAIGGSMPAAASP